MCCGDAHALKVRHVILARKMLRDHHSIPLSENLFHILVGLTVICKGGSARLLVRCVLRSHESYDVLSDFLDFLLSLLLSLVRLKGRRFWEIGLGGFGWVWLVTH